MQSDSFTYKVEETPDGKVYRIAWLNRPMDIRVYDRLCKLFKAASDYGPTTPRKLNTLRSVVDGMNQELGSRVTVDQAISLRNIVIKDKIIKNYSRMNGRIDRISAEYNSGHDILALSAAYDFPPLNLLRGILIRNGYNSGQLYQVFANKSGPSPVLSGRDLRQFRRAEANDAESTFNQQKAAEVAAANESRFVEFFRGTGARIMTQDDLAKEQISEFGRAVITPDLLFIDRVFINGSPVAWIDFKDYMGTKVHFLYSSNSNQAGKYTEKWGPGAMCYHRGYVEGLVIPGASLLDARALPVKFEQ